MIRKLIHSLYFLPDMQRKYYMKFVELCALLNLIVI